MRKDRLDIYRKLLSVRPETDAHKQHRGCTIPGLVCFIATSWDFIHNGGRVDPLNHAIFDGEKDLMAIARYFEVDTPLAMDLVGYIFVGEQLSLKAGIQFKHIIEVIDRC